MPITNLNNTHISAEQRQQANELISQLEEILKVKNINLSAEERRKYGSISEQNKLFVNKVYDYSRTQPQLKSPDVEWNEFVEDVESRSFLEGIIARLENLNNGLTNAKTLHDYDNYQAALDDYAYTAYKAGTEAAGYETKLNDLKQFFSRVKSQE